MAYQTLGGGFWAPWLPEVFVGTGTGTYVIDATSEKAVAVFRCPKAGTIDRFDFYVATVTNSPDNGLRASLQGVDGSGQNDGTILGATNNGYVTYAHTVTTGWKSSNFGESVTVTEGQLVAAVIDIPSFTASDNVAVQGITNANASFPYGLSITGTKQTGGVPVIALHYTDGYVFLDERMPAFESGNIHSYNSGSTPDEYGNYFTGFPFGIRIGAIGFSGSVAAGADFDLVLYDSGGSSLGSVSMDGDVVGGTGTLKYFGRLTSAVEIAASTPFRVALKPTTANNVGLRVIGLNSADLLDTMDWGQTIYKTSRVNAGSWTDYISSGFSRAYISVFITAIDVGGGGGGLLAHPGMRGGFA